jgi:D-alanyl-D-alanine carboxypeptidase
MMTRQAHALGMNNTTFRNASGLPNTEQLTTARDLATLGRRLIADFPEYYHYFSTPSFRFHQRVIPNHNPMLKVYAGAEGMKTGYTQEAGHNLVTSAMRDNVRLVGVVLGSSSNSQRTQIMASQLDRGFDVEGVAPVERPLMLARASTPHSVMRQHRVIAMAGASRHKALEVAEAATPHARRGHTSVAHDHHVRLIGAKVHAISARTHPVRHTTTHARNRT